MKRGFYFIGVHETDKNGDEMFIPALEEGSIEEYGRLFIHRKIDSAWDPTGWRISHVNSGACVLAGLNLKSARMLIKLLQPFKIWDIKTYQEIRKACQDMDNPEVVEIMDIRHRRA